MAEYLFNVDHGYLEGLVRGFRSGILTRVDYLNLVQCETVDGELLFVFRRRLTLGGPGGGGETRLGDCLLSFFPIELAQI